MGFKTPKTARSAKLGFVPPGKNVMDENELQCYGGAGGLSNISTVHNMIK